MENEIEWNRVKFFKPTDNWGEVERIVPNLVYELDKFRTLVGSPVMITCGTQGTHEENSEHYKGRAVDIIVPDRKPSDLLDLALSALRLGFTGVGVYPKWKYNGKVTGGLHLDIREAAQRAFWMGVPTPDGRQTYVALNRENLIRHGILGVLA